MSLNTTSRFGNAVVIFRGGQNIGHPERTSCMRLEIFGTKPKEVVELCEC